MSFSTVPSIENANPRKPNDQIALADAWIAYADDAQTAASAKGWSHRRAAGWLKLAERSLSGLEKVKVSQRTQALESQGVQPLELGSGEASDSVQPERVTDPIQIASESGLLLLDNGIRDASWAKPGLIDVLAMVELPRDQVYGAWKRHKKSLISPKDKYARIRLPLIPPEQYELLLDIQPHGNARDISICLTAPGGHRFSVKLNREKKGPWSGIDHIDGKDCSENETWFKGYSLIPGKVNRVVISVRRDGIDVEVNRRPIARYRGDMKRLTCHSDWEEPGRTTIVLGTYASPTSIHSAVIKPIGEDGSRAVVPVPEIKVGSSQWVRDKLPEASEIDRLPDSVYLDQLPEISFSVASGVLGKNGEQGVTGRDALVLGRKQYSHGLAMNPGNSGSARVTYLLHGKFRRLESNIGLCENKWNKPGKTISAVVGFKVYGDGKLLSEFRNGRVSGKLETISADLTGVHALSLVVQCSGKTGGDWAAWIEPKVHK